MHSMTAALAAHTSSPPDPATENGGWVADAFAAAWNWGAATLPGGNTTMFGILLVLGIAADQTSKKKKGGGTARPSGKGFLHGVGSLFKGLWGGLVALCKAVWAVARFYGGRELRGEPRSNATFFRAGTRRTDPLDAPAVQLGSIAFAPPRVSLVKAPRRQPSPWARNAATWLGTYSGRGAAFLDWAVRAVRWAVRMARKVHQWYQATAGVVRTVYGVVAPVVRTLAHALRAWHCWPYAARGLTRLGLTVALLGLTVPAWRTWTIVALVVAAAGLSLLAHRFQPKAPGDDAVYGPKVWTILRADLGLPDTEPRESWLQLPERLADPGARIVLRLPWTFRGSDIEKDNIGSLINSRLPGEWAGRFSFQGEHATAVYTHKPPPKPTPPAPECPEGVSFFDPDIQEAIANCKKGQIVVGKDAFGRIIIKEMGTSETPHWALSVGTGGGKSSFCQMVIAQLIAQGYYIVGADVKRVSVTNFKDVVGCYIYNDPMNVYDMRKAIKWFSEELSARSAIAEVDPTAEFPGILCLIEESNEFADISKEWWDENRKPTSDKFGPADPAADPTWGDIASAARVGRHVYGNILAVFQDLRDQALGGKGIRNLFRLKYMGNYSVQSWKNVIGTTPVPESVDKAGRMMIVEGNQQYWIQTPYAKPEELRAWAIQARERTGFTEGAGLFGTPPTPSPKRLPRLLERLSRDELPEALRTPSEGGLNDETAGRPSHDGADVTLSGADVTPSRDRLRLVPTQGGPDAQEAAPDPLAGPELLPLAEISRRLEGVAGIPKEATVRAHSTRREDFPQPTINGKKKLYLESQIRAYYQQQEKQA
ncbi:hypothetical protein ACTU45_24395 [Streptomyces sp. 24-1644]|uniref:hypothetical protein n=1 Tax=Streptomyces sp. 24-1644 TaxID=3457315 RepID=UPI003FA6D384